MSLWNIAPWNRSEVFMGASMQDFCKVRELLSENNIIYDFRIMNRDAWGRGIGGLSPARGRIQSPFGNQEIDCTYYVYVNKQDYENASYLLRNR